MALDIWQSFAILYAILLIHWHIKYDHKDDK